MLASSLAVFYKAHVSLALFITILHCQQWTIMEACQLTTPTYEPPTTTTFRSAAAISTLEVMVA
jgi:hypothetical protein